MDPDHGQNQQEFLLFYLSNPPPPFPFGQGAPPLVFFFLVEKDPFMHYVRGKKFTITEFAKVTVAYYFSSPSGDSGNLFHSEHFLFGHTKTGSGNSPKPSSFVGWNESSFHKGISGIDSRHYSTHCFYLFAQRSL